MSFPANRRKLFSYLLVICLASGVVLAGIVKFPYLRSFFVSPQRHTPEPTAKDDLSLNSPGRRVNRSESAAFSTSGEGRTSGGAQLFEPVQGDQEFNEDPDKRRDWFIFQRAFPFGVFSEEGRRRAWEARPQESPLQPLQLQTTWTSIGPTPTDSVVPNNWGVTSGRINAIAVSPINPNLILIGSSTGGIWRSTDGGANFVPVADSQVDLAVGSLAFSRSNSSIVYAGMGDARTGAYLGSGVLKSTDAGQTWTRISNATLPSPGYISRIDVDAVDPNRVYVAQYAALFGRQVFSSGCYVSTDGGVNWTRKLSGLAKDIAAHPTTPNVAYVAMSRVDEAGSPPAGLYRSTDGGGVWSRIYTTPYDSNRTSDIKVALTPANSQFIYVYTGGFIGSVFETRVEVSANSGASFINRGASGVDRGQFGYNTYIYVSPTDANTVYVGTRDIYKSTDAGVSWTNMTRNFDPPGVNGCANPSGCYHPSQSNTHPDQHSLAFSPTNSNIVYAGNDGGISKSTDGAVTFQSLNATLSLSQLVGYALHPTNAAISYGGTQDNGTQRRLAAPAGQWKEFSSGDGGWCVINPLNPSMVFTTYVQGSISRWLNNGATFDKQVATNATFGESSGARIAFYPPFTGNEVNSMLYFGTWRLFVSANLGDTWTAPAGALDLTKGSGDVLSAIGVARSNPNVIYTGSSRGRAMVSANGGASWTDITSGLPERFITSITVNPTNPAVAYLTVSGYGSGHIFKTSNSGGSWSDISGNLPDIPTNALLIDPLTPSTLYAGTDIGVFRSTADGIAWSGFNNGLPPVIVYAFDAQSNGRIQLASYGRGAYEMSAACTLTCPTNVSVTSPAATVVTYPAPTVSDNCTGGGSPVCAPPSGSTFPLGATTVNCNVSDASGNLASCSFTVTVTPGGGSCPTVSGINPSNGAVGSSVIITGSNFTGVTAVKFSNNIPALFTVNSATQITATVPSGAVSGPLTISKSGCSDVQTAAFTVGSATGGTFTQQQKLTASDGKANDEFGFSVALSGDNAIVGAKDENFTQGAAYVFVRTNGNWAQQQKLTASDGRFDDQFGYAVAISGDTALVGSRSSVSGGSRQGTVYVFVRTNGNWTERQRLTASDGKNNDGFGWSIAISGDTAIIGAVGASAGANTNQGAAYVFVRNNGAWAQQQKLIANEAVLGPFGHSVALSGDTAVVGALYAEAAYVFTRANGAWTRQQKLTASDGKDGDTFGYATAISGDTAIIGARWADISGNTERGAAYVYVRANGAWTQQQKLTASDGRVNDYFGSSVAVNADTALVGAIGVDTGANINQGAAYAFTRANGTWTQQQKLTGSDSGIGDVFGQSIAISGGTVIVGAIGATVSERSNQGAAYVFTTSASTPCPTVSSLNPSSGAVGNSVTITGANFTGITSVKFANNVTASFTVNNDTQITTTVPAGAVTGPITLSKTGCADVQTAAFTVTQASCTFGLTPTNGAFSANGGSGNVTVNASANSCAWQATSNAAWITITSGASGNGNGSVNFSVAANTGSSQRTGTMTIAGQTFTVTQSGGSGCSYSISQTFRSFSVSGGTGSVTVNTASGCAWTAVSNASWITITSGAGGSGNGTVNYSVAANADSSQRTGMMTIAGQTFGLTQCGSGSSICEQFDSPPTQARLNGAAIYDSARQEARLTPNEIYRAGSIFFVPTTLIDRFTATFQLRIDGQGADGMTFAVIESGANSLGGDGAGLGYENISGRSFAIEFDTFYNSGEDPLATPHVGLNVNGSVTSIATAGLPPLQGQGNLTVRVVFDRGAVQVFLPEKQAGPVLNAAIPNWTPFTGRFGFTAATGGLSQIHVVDSVVVDLQGTPSCSYALSATSQSFTAGGGSGSVNVTAPSGCAWTAASNASWITITSGASGNGNGAVNYSVATNTSASQRSGTMTIAGQTFTVTQSSGSGCTYSISPTFRSFSVSGGTGSVTVNTASGCAWTAVSNASWLSITAGASGSGPGTVSYSVAVNPAASPRSGTLTIAGQTFTVSQSGCVSFSAYSRYFETGGGTGSFSVFAASGCAWTAASSAPWLTLTGATSGDGNGTITYSVAANTGSPARGATINVSGNFYYVDQRGNGSACATTPIALGQTISGSLNTSDCVSPSRGIFGTHYADRYTFSGVSGQRIAILQNSTAFDSYVFLIGPDGTILYRDDDGGGFPNSRIPPVTGFYRLPATGTYIVEATSYSSGRTGDYTLSLNTTCVELSPVSQTFTSNGGSASATVTAASGCAWTATSDVSWLTVNSGSGNGSGTINYSVAPNSTGSPRRAALAIAGDVFVVNQSSDSLTLSTDDGAFETAIGYGGSNGYYVNRLTPTSYPATLSAVSIYFAAGSVQVGDQITILAGANPSGADSINNVALRSVSATVQALGQFNVFTVPQQTITSGDFVVGFQSSAAFPCPIDLSGPALRRSYVSFSGASFLHIEDDNPYLTSNFGIRALLAQQACTYAINPTSQNLTASGGADSVAVTSQSGCVWTATSNASWITITSGTSGNGNGTVGYSVVANTSASQRAGTMTIAGQTFTVTQAGGAPNPAPTLTSINPSSVIAGGAAFTLIANGTNFVSGSVVRWNGNDRQTTFVSSTELRATIPASDIASAGSASVTVFNPAPGGGASNARTFAVANPVPMLTSLNPSWTAAGGAAFTLTVTGTNFTNDSFVYFDGVNRRPSFVSSTQLNAAITAAEIARAHTVSVRVFSLAPGGGWSNELSFTITEACSYAIQPTSQTFGASGGMGSVTVTAGSGCGWTAAAADTWINITSGASGSGNGVVAYNVAANNGPARTGAIQVAGQTFTVAQAGQSCSYTISPTSQSFQAAGGNGQVQVNVTTGTGCNWTATSNAAFITITGAASGSGSGSVSYAVGANNGPARSGTLTIASQTFTVTQAEAATTARTLRAGAASGAPGSTVSVPIELLAQGDESALGFSLTFDPAVLSNPQAALGADASGASLNTNGSQTGQGRFGIALALPSGQRFNAGARQVVNVTFAIAAGASGSMTPIGFGDQPVPREISDTSANSLPANYVAGSVTLTQGFEADVAPRSSGNGSVTITDWVQIGRFIAGTDTPNPGSEFQRADVAPRASLGDGRLTVTDWVQAGRYVSGEDAVVAAGGPANPASSATAEADSLRFEPDAAQPNTRTLRIVQASLERGQSGALIVEFDAQGNESALGFSLSFDPAQLRFVSAALGAGATGVTLNLNTNQTANGRLGVALALPTGQTFAAGAHQLLVVTFIASGNGNPTTTTVGFVDQPVPREVSDPNADAQPATYTAGAVQLTRSVANVSAASFLGQSLASESIVAAFGSNLATGVGVASSLPLPIALLGTTVKVRDALGVERLASLFFVAPSQVNYQIPPGTALGTAAVTITSGDGLSSSGQAQIERVAPGLISANGNGQGVAAAVALRVKADGAQNFEPVARFDAAQGRFVPVPIDLGPASDQVFLILFGTGFRFRNNLADMTVRIGGVGVTTLFAGAAPGFVGLDQINLGPIPRSLIGRGEMEINVTVEGGAANAVRISVR